MTQELESLYKLEKDDLHRVGPVLADAFSYDPVWTKVFAGEKRVGPKLRAFFETPVTYFHKYGEVYASSEHLEGIAAWGSGKYTEMSFWRTLRSGALKPGLGIGLSIMWKMRPVFQLEKDRLQYMQGRPHAYLAVIGVSSAHQGKGLGGKLIRGFIDACEARGEAAYLDTETEGNVAMYEQYGFEVIKEVRLGGCINLPMWAMVRESSGKA